MPFRTCSRKVAVSRSLWRPGWHRSRHRSPTAASAFVRSYRVLERKKARAACGCRSTRTWIPPCFGGDGARPRNHRRRVRDHDGAAHGPSLLVGGDSSEEASATVVKTLAAGGVQVQAAAVRDEPSLVAAAGRQAAQALWLVATSSSEGSIRGHVRFRALRAARAAPGRGPGCKTRSSRSHQTERDFAGDETAARLRAGSAPPGPWRANCPPCFGPFPRVRVT